MFGVGFSAISGPVDQGPLLGHRVRGESVSGTRWSMGVSAGSLSLSPEVSLRYRLVVGSRSVDIQGVWYLRVRGEGGFSGRGRVRTPQLRRRRPGVFLLRVSDIQKQRTGRQGRKIFLCNYGLLPTVTGQSLELHPTRVYKHIRSCSSRTKGTTSPVTSTGRSLLRSPVGPYVGDYHVECPA